MPKTVLITGASSGFGRDTAETLARDGQTVYASMRDIGGRNRPHTETLRAHGVNVVELDVTDDASVESAVGAVIAKAGRIDVLVNNAGIAAAGVSEAFTPDQAKIVFNTNVVGLLRTTRAVLPAMRRQGDGLIINIGSILGRVTFPFFGIYGASKFAVEALTDSYRYELSQLGVDVVLVQPSAYPTNMYASVQQPADGRRAEGYGAIGEFRRLPLPYEAGFVAGRALVEYRRRGGVRTSPLPNFNIGAHAAVAGLTLLTRDARRYAGYFPKVELIAPG